MPLICFDLKKSTSHHTSTDRLYHFNWMNRIHFIEVYFFGSILLFVFLTALLHWNIAHVMDFKLDKATTHNKTNQYKTICTRSLSQTFSLAFFLHIARWQTQLQSVFFSVKCACACDAATWTFGAIYQNDWFIRSATLCKWAKMR